MKIATTTTIKQESLNPHDFAIKQESLNPHGSASISEVLDDTELELERIMFEELAQGLPSDIPMADW